MRYRQQESDAAVVLEPQEAANAAVIWLHGLGADGYDFVPIAPELSLPQGVNMRFIFPHAPVRPVTLNNGIAMRAWYDIKGLDRHSAEDAEGIQQSADTVSALLDQQRAGGIDAKRLFVAGFSQGGAITLHAALRYAHRLAGVIALSTYLPLRDRLVPEAAAANQDVPILICHGSMDPMVPVQLGEASRELLLQAGYKVDWHTYPMQHQVCMEEIEQIAGFIASSLEDDRPRIILPPGYR
jgi:phospholipase/carboxylesterase